MVCGGAPLVLHYLAELLPVQRADGRHLAVGETVILMTLSPHHY